MLQRKGAGQPQISDEKIESVRVAYTRSPIQLIRRLLFNCRFHAPLFTKFGTEICDFMHIAYSKVQLLQALTPEDKPRRKEFAVTLLHRLDSDPGFLKRVCFRDESTFLD